MSFSVLLIGLITFVELNCENLFDTEHDSLKNDYDFMPTAIKHWTKNRYWEKLDNIGREILACGGDSSNWTPPDLVALCEVENDSVMRDLTNRSLLRNVRYKYVMTNSPDIRGIDVALLYSPFSFCLVNYYSLHVDPLKGMRQTRDILYVCGVLPDNDTIHVFVVHAPSRFGGEKNTRSHRLKVAEVLCNATDSIYLKHPDARIIIAGDFNDYTGSASMNYISKHKLMDVSEKAVGRNGAGGTYKYKGDWHSLDHIFFSEKLQHDCNDCYVMDASFLIKADSKFGGVEPWRSYIGPRYQKGFSDHLPLVVKFCCTY